jgi:hypothetical protein
MELLDGCRAAMASFEDKANKANPVEVHSKVKKANEVLQQMVRQHPTNATAQKAQKEAQQILTQIVKEKLGLSI